MMDLRTLRRLNLEATGKAAREKKQPLMCNHGDNGSTAFQDLIPYIGDGYSPKGWTRVDIAKEFGIADPENERGLYDNTYFVDTTGFGRSYELALTEHEFRKLLKVGYGYAVIERGPMQEHIAVFKRKERKAKKA